MKTETIKAVAKLEVTARSYEELDTSAFFREVQGFDSIKEKKSFIYEELKYQKEAKQDIAELLKIVVLREHYVETKELAELLITINRTTTDLNLYLMQLERI